ncbi:DUF4167 domain-containing protein [Aureimonas flava]|nr:DUF4167 domain-containing protein [Aureimonas flava]
MRPGQQQQNKRMRGRGGRKGPNPLSRSFESNGPDVKIRGTAQHIADKYTTLARDAAAAGDRVMAENYLQHAEHYGRIVAAAQGQFQPSQPERDYADFDDEDGEEGQGPEAGQPYAGGQDRPQNGFGGERQGGERHANDRQGFRDGQNGRGERRDGRDNRGERPFQNRDGQNRDGQNRDGQGREGQGRDGSSYRDGRQPGTGPQPFPQGPDVDAEGGAPRQDAGRFEGGRRESRRERARLNERSGERRFEERFGRQRAADEGRTDAPAAERRDQPDEASAQPAPVAAIEPAATSLPPVPAPVVAETVGEPGSAEPRVRARKRRDAGETDAVSAVEPAVSPAAPSEDSVPAPARRRSAKAAPSLDAPVAAEDETAPKRRVARPRRKKDEGEGGEERSPALLDSDG